MLSFIELTGYVDDQHGYDDNSPAFDRHLWPFLLRNSDAVENTFLFRHSSWNLNKKAFEAGEKITANVANIGPMERLSNKQLKQIESWSFFGGHLNVLYEIDATSPMLSRLLMLYPQPGRIGNEEIDNLGLKSNEISELAMLVQSISDSYVLASFAHDADPLYIFGSPLMLRSLLNSVCEHGSESFTG